MSETTTRVQHFFAERGVTIDLITFAQPVRTCGSRFLITAEKAMLRTSPITPRFVHSDGATRRPPAAF